MGISKFISFLHKPTTLLHLILLIIIATPILIAINFLISSYLIYGTGTMKIHAVDIKTPLVLNYQLDPKKKDFQLKKFLKELKITLGDKISLQKKHSLLIDIEWIMNANPYPPLLSEFSPTYPKQNYISFGYISTSNVYKQITYYWGESDTTPSILTNKVRGKKTYYGDYYITYAFYLSKHIMQAPISKNKTSQTTKWHLYQKMPQINHIEWISDSSEMTKECTFILFATLLELILIILFLFGRRRS